MYCLCTRCIIVNTVQVRSEFGKFAYTAICMRKCTLWSDNTCVFTRFHSVKTANTQLIWSSVAQTQRTKAKKLSWPLCATGQIALPSPPFLQVSVFCIYWSLIFKLWGVRDILLVPVKCVFLTSDPECYLEMEKKAKQNKTHLHVVV